MTDRKKSGRPGQPIPDDFMSVAPTMCWRPLAAHYGVSCKVINRWTREAGVKTAGLAPRTKLLPEGFAEVAHLSTAELSQRFGASKGKIVAWRKEVGFRRPAKPRPEPRAPRQPSARPAPKARSGNRGQWGPKPAPITRDDSAAGVAADGLRRLGYLPVCRARIRDPKAPADQWIVGRRTLTTDEMMRLAAERTRRAAA